MMDRPWERRAWSIAFCAGASPFALEPVAPVPRLTASLVSDLDAQFVADPFLLRRHDRWELYFEILRRADRKGLLGRATSTDLGTWRYDGVVFEESFHLSYPQVFAHDGAVWMLPETLGAGALRLYREAARGFALEAELLAGSWADPSLLHLDGRWWLWACATTPPNRTLHLFTAENLLGPWREHPASPVVREDPKRARPAGRVILLDGRPLRFAQDCLPRYGSRVRAFEILRLDPREYEERERPESPVLDGGGTGWNANGMHHIDPHQLDDGSWIAAVDGDRYENIDDQRVLRKLLASAS